MRGRRHKLQVSTFPFLAVLLCAMGSLILILLVMDRKAHKAAQARAQREAIRLAEESAHSAAAREAEVEQKKQQARAAWEQKRDALHAKLTSEQVELQLQMRKVRDQLGAIAARLRYEQDTSTELRRKVKDERGKIQTEEQLLLTLRSGSGQAATQSKESSKSLRRMTLDLLQMEQALKDLKAARQREQHTFSVVPYHGRRGENRRPIYVECTATGVIFHPERRAMPVTTRSFLVGQDKSDEPPDDVRAEVERRITQRRAKRAGAAGTADTTPYLLLLVRPDGVNTYHIFQAALKGLDLDFGYEFIDADWVLDFPADDDQPSAQPWMVATKTPTAPAAPAASPTNGGNPRPIGMGPNGTPGLQGIRTNEGGGAGQWLSRGSARPAGTGGTAPGVGGSGALVRGGVPSGTGISAGGTTSGPGPPGNGTSGPAGPASSSGGVSGLAAGTGFGQAGPANGQSPGLFGQPGGSGTSLVPSASGGGNGPANGGTAWTPNRSGGRGHPSALAPSLEEGGGGIGAASEGGTPGNGYGAPGGYVLGGASGNGYGAPGGYVKGGTGRPYGPGSTLSSSPLSSDSATTSLGPPQALSPGSTRIASSGTGVSGSSGTGYPGGNGTAALGSNPSGTNVSGSMGNGAGGGSNSGSPGSNFAGSQGTGSGQGARGGTSGNGVPGNGIAGNGMPGNGVPGNGTQGNGVSGNGMGGTGASGTGVAGNGVAGNGTAGNGAAGNGVAGNGTPGGGSSSSNPALLAPPGASPNGGYAVARGPGGGGSGQPGILGSGGSGQPGIPGGSSSGAAGGSSSGQPGVAGIPGSGGTSPAAAGQVPPGTPGATGQRGSSGTSAGGYPGQPPSGQPGAAGGAPGDGSGSAPGGNGSAAYAAVDPLMPRQPRGLRPADRGEEPAEPPPENTSPDAPRRKALVQGGVGSGGSGDSSAPPSRFATPVYQTPKPRKPANLRPAWVHGGRDWTIYVECLHDGVKLYPSEKTFPFAQAASAGPNNPLVVAIRQMIDRRQSARRPGEPPYYPQVRLLVQPENVRTFLKVYPALEALPVPKTRQNLDPDDDVRDIVTGASP